MTEKEKCDCAGTGWVGDCGPGKRNNGEYMPCDCEKGKAHIRRELSEKEAAIKQARAEVYAEVLRIVKNAYRHDKNTPWKWACSYIGLKVQLATDKAKNA